MVWTLGAEMLVVVSVVPSSVWKLVKELDYCLIELSAWKWVSGCWGWELVDVLSVVAMWAAEMMVSASVVQSMVRMLWALTMTDAETLVSELVVVHLVLASLVWKLVLGWIESSAWKLVLGY